MGIAEDAMGGFYIKWNGVPKLNLIPKYVMVQGSLKHHP
jgi:hypothetical protein